MWIRRQPMRNLVALSAVLVLGVLSTRVLAAAPAAGVSESQVFLAHVAGVYKERFQNELVSGEKFESEDILEVVPVDDTHAYIRMHLEFYNGHMGALYGIAAVNGRDSLLFDDGEAVYGRCVLTITWSAGQVVTSADYDKTPGCRNYHGARGTLNDITFNVAKQRTIKYMQRLKDSREFKSAMEDYRKRSAAK